MHNYISFLRYRSQSFIQKILTIIFEYHVTYDFRSFILNDLITYAIIIYTCLICRENKYL